MLDSLQENQPLGQANLNFSPKIDLRTVTLVVESENHHLFIIFNHFPPVSPHFPYCSSKNGLKKGKSSKEEKSSAPCIHVVSPAPLANCYVS